MKKRICLLLCICLLFPLIGCAGSTEESENQFSFYYRRENVSFGTENGVIAPEIRELTAEKADLNAILDVYFGGPLDSAFQSPFPRESRLLDYSCSEEEITLTMNDAFSALSGVELTIACSCIAKTLLELTGTSRITIQAEDALLDGAQTITLTDGDLCLYDDSLDLFRADFTVYYTDTQRRYLIAQEISVNLATEPDIIAHLVERMTLPPENSGLLSALPPDTKLLDYSIDDGLCTINFSQEFEFNTPAKIEAQRLCLLSVVNTLTQLEQVDQVEFRADGNLLVKYGRINLPQPLTRDENAIGPVRTGMGEFDATLYLSNNAEQHLAAVPTRLRQSTGISRPEMVISSLIGYPSQNGFFSTIPANTKIRSVEVRNGICYVDLSEEFLAHNEHLTVSVRSMVASLCSLEEIVSVRITIDGTSPEGEYRHLFVVLSPQSNWFL